MSRTGIIKYCTVLTHWLYTETSEYSYQLELNFYIEIPYMKGFPGGASGKESACNEEDVGLIPGLGRSPGEGYDNSHHYSCLENFMDRGAW